MGVQFITMATYKQEFKISSNKDFQKSHAHIILTMTHYTLHNLHKQSFIINRLWLQGFSKEKCCDRLLYKTVWGTYPVGSIGKITLSNGSKLAGAYPHFHTRMEIRSLSKTLYSVWNTILSYACYMPNVLNPLHLILIISIEK